MTEGSSALSEEIVERDVSLRDLLMLGSGGFAGALWITVGRTGLSLLSETLGRPGLGIRQLDLVLCLGLTVMLSSNEGLRMDGGLELLVSGKEIWCREEEGREVELWLVARETREVNNSWRDSVYSGGLCWARLPRREGEEIMFWTEFIWLAGDWKSSSDLPRMELLGRAVFETSISLSGL